LADGFAIILGTHTQTLIYASTNASYVISLSKMGSWYMLLYLGSATVTIVSHAHLNKAKVP
jgi:hypothetical protein